VGAACPFNALASPLELFPDLPDLFFAVAGICFWQQRLPVASFVRTLLARVVCAARPRQASSCPTVSAARNQASHSTVFFCVRIAGRICCYCVVSAGNTPGQEHGPITRSRCAHDFEPNFLFLLPLRRPCGSRPPKSRHAIFTFGGQRRSGPAWNRCRRQSCRYSLL